MDDATAIDETTSALISPRRRAESFFRMKDSAGGVDIGATVAGVAEGDFPRERTMG